MVHCGDGSQRLFILEKEGFVRILTHNMELLKEPFLDIHKLVQSGLKVSGTQLLFVGFVELSVGWIDSNVCFIYLKVCSGIFFFLIKKCYMYIKMHLYQIKITISSVA